MPPPPWGLAAYPASNNEERPRNLHAFLIHAKMSSLANTSLARAKARYRTPACMHYSLSRLCLGCVICPYRMRRLARSSVLVGLFIDTAALFVVCRVTGRAGYQLYLKMHYQTLGISILMSAAMARRTHMRDFHTTNFAAVAVLEPRFLWKILTYTLMDNNNKNHHGRISEVLSSK